MHSKAAKLELLCNLKIILFTATLDEEKQQIFTFDEM